MGFVNLDCDPQTCTSWKPAWLEYDKKLGVGEWDNLHRKLPKPGAKVTITHLGGQAYGRDAIGKEFTVHRHVYDERNGRIGFTIKIQARNHWEKNQYKPIFPQRGDTWATHHDHPVMGSSAMSRTTSSSTDNEEWKSVFAVQVVETIDGWVGQVTTNVRGKSMIAYQSEPYDETKLTTDEQKGKSEDEIETACRDKAQADATSAARKAVKNLFTATTPAATTSTVAEQ